MLCLPSTAQGLRALPPVPAGGLWTLHRPTPLRGAYRLGSWGCPGWWAAGPAASARPSRVFSLGVPAFLFIAGLLLVFFSLFSSLRTRFLPLLASSFVFLPALHILLALPLFAIISRPFALLWARAVWAFGPSWPRGPLALRTPAPEPCVGGGVPSPRPWPLGPWPPGPRGCTGPGARRPGPASSARDYYWYSTCSP